MYCSLVKKINNFDEKRRQKLKSKGLIPKRRIKWSLKDQIFVIDFKNIPKSMARTKKKSWNFLSENVTNLLQQNIKLKQREEKGTVGTKVKPTFFLFLLLLKMAEREHWRIRQKKKKKSYVIQETKP